MVRVPPRHDTPNQREPGEALYAERGVRTKGRAEGEGDGEREWGREVWVLLTWGEGVVVQGVEVDSDGVVVKGDVEDVLEEGLGCRHLEEGHRQIYRFNERT